MPTEELFGAYNFLLEVAGDERTDSFDFTTPPEDGEAAMILPAVQRIPEEVLVEATSESGAQDDPGASADASHIEAYEVKWGARIGTEGRASQANGGDHDPDGIDALMMSFGSGGSSVAATDRGGLRSDGDLVQGLTVADMGGDFIL